ncbi:MAG: PGPGW domain-containing protein [Ornithinibacter sp.]
MTSAPDHEQERELPAAHGASHDPVLRTEDDEDWAWRRRIRANTTTRRAYRALVLVVGLVLVLGGLALVPLPGPGWLIVILGIAIWASEFEAASRLRDFVIEKVRAWEVWMRAQPFRVQAIVGLATAALALVGLWLTIRLIGIPGFVPDGLTQWLHTTARL